MKEFLRKIRLIENFTTELKIQKNDFVIALRAHVDEGSTDFMSGSFDGFSSSKNEFKGHVGFDGFKIKRRGRFFETNMNTAIAKGTYLQKEDSLLIKTEINGFHGMMIPLYAVGLLIYSIAIVGLLFADNVERNVAAFTIPFLLIHAGFMFGIPYYLMRRSTRKMAYD